MTKSPIILLAASLTAGAALADENHAIHQAGAITSPADVSKIAAFDVLASHAHRTGNQVTFHMTTNGVAGAEVPEAVGAVGGAPVLSYVWPTSLDPSVVGFEAGTGILAMAATSHPDFDDTPLVDENLDGDPENDGIIWHSHWGCVDADRGVRSRSLGRA